MSASSIRNRLRDTALEVSLLSQGAMSVIHGSLRERCDELVRSLAMTLSADGVDEITCKEVVYAQCALLDEAALGHIGGQERADWERNPLQLARFGQNDAGERVFERLASRMAEPVPRIDILECYATVLSLGYKGRYARDGETARQAIIERLEQMIAAHRPPAEDVFIVDVSRGPRWRGFSAVVTAVFALAGAVVIYALCRHSLHESLMMLTPSVSAASSR